MLKDGFRKIEFCAKQALEDGLEFIWVDTCCIDKSSSAELSEAINSMYQWYQDAAVCYTYLPDVPARPDPDDRDPSWAKKFQQSRWFTRGWTLQEMIAPKSVVFYSQDWRRLGTRATMAEAIEACTGVPSSVLYDRDLDRVSIAQRMSSFHMPPQHRAWQVRQLDHPFFADGIHRRYGPGRCSRQR